MQKIEICPLCGSDKQSLFYDGIDKYYSQKKVRYVSCDNCGFIFLNPRPTDEEYKEMYKTVFQDKRRKLETVEQSITRLEGIKSYEAKTPEMEYFRSFVDKNSTCLEVGSGWGTLAKVVKDTFGCDPDLVEPSVLAAKTAQEYYGLKVYCEEFDAFAEKCDKKYDFIFSYYLLEHLLDVNSFLEKLKKLLHKDTKLLFAIPNVANQDHPSEVFFHIEHTYYYSPKTVTLMLNKHGYRVIKLWDCKYDIKVACEPDDSVRNIDFSQINAREDIRIIKKKITRYDKRFKVLRFFKKIIFIFVDKNRQDQVTRLMAKILRSLNIIKR